ncbi:hypothetical protein DFP72DRAFT_1069414 [Ephemerocybe angulata]|uniref:Uncharacterized protein n=1 Tax=Ephemerocybe angulata TaxID=980116 RepID=A0A8H6HX31_9AGAR|nr:hypothetical protein DFP72DRAFT_1069414 [Tulosesus angulatus]
MSDDRNRQARRRPAQTHFRTEALLNAAQRGSPEHLERLAKEWPEDISYSKKALTIVFDHLEMQLELLPSQRSLQDCPPIDTIRTCLDALAGAFNSLPSHNSDHKEEFFMVLRPRLKVLFRCLRFLMRYSPLLYVRPYQGRTKASIHLSWILNSRMCRADDVESLELVVDFALCIWLDVAASPWEEGVSMSPEIYRDQYLAAYQPVILCLGLDLVRDMFLQKVNALDHRSLKSLAYFFILPMPPLANSVPETVSARPR